MDEIELALRKVHGDYGHRKLNPKCPICHIIGLLDRERELHQFDVIRLQNVNVNSLLKEQSGTS